MQRKEDDGRRFKEGLDADERFADATAAGTN
jgi:hypothetical protein